MCLGFLKSSLGKKYVMAVTGIFLFGFVVAHMIGNLQIFLGPKVLNDYARHLAELPGLLWPARIFLLTTLVVHIGVATQLTLENRKARPQAYAAKDYVKASYASRTMMMSGIIVFLFIVYHLLHFTFGVTNPELFHLPAEGGYYDVYRMVVLSYQNPWISGAYILAMIPLCLHLSHGLSSLFQSLGLNNAQRQPFFTGFARLSALAIFIGNSSIPAAAFLGILK